MGKENGVMFQYFEWYLPSDASLWKTVGESAQALAERGVTEVLAHIHPDHTASQRIATHLGLHPTSEMVDGEIAWRGTPA